MARPLMGTLLIVEDDPNLRRLYREEFEDEGYEVLTASTGEEALEHVSRQPVAAVVIDICLGGANGIEVMHRLLMRNPGLAVILNSAYTSFKSDFSTWAAERYVVKSSDVSELKRAVADSLRERGGASRAA